MKNTMHDPREHQIDLRAGRIKRGNKFGAVRTSYRDRIYDSKMEADYAAELDMLVRAKAIKGWEPQIRIPLMVDGQKVCDYIIDFRIQHLNGTLEYVEVKGHETDVWKLKWKLFLILFKTPIEAAGGKITLQK